MATQKASTKPAAQTKQGHEDAEERMDNVIGRTEQFIYNNGKTLLTALTVIVLLVGGYYAYKHLYQAGREQKAAAAIYVAQQNMDQEMYEVALNGDARFALSVLYGYQNRQRLLLYTSLIDWFL